LVRTESRGMDRQQILAIILVVLMIGSSVAYAAASVF
jgi:PhoPQ-activated pathogenicity-related protein